MTDLWILVFGFGMFVSGYIAAAMKIKLRQQRRRGYMRPVPKAARRYMA